MTSPKSSKKPINAISKTTTKTSSLSSLKMKLQKSDPEIQHYVTALEAENLKCVKKLAQLQAENVTLNNRITVLKESGEADTGQDIRELIAAISKQPANSK
jgi:hypothetical protein